MSAPSIVVFDFGGVLLEWDPRHLYRKIFVDDEAGMEHFLTHVCSVTWNMMQDAGRTFDAAVAELTDRFPQHAELIAAYHERWEETQPYVFDDTVSILKELKANGVPVYGITNFSAEKFAITRKRHSFLDLLEGIVVSGEVHLMKPDPGIFLHFLNQFGLEASQCAFIDDSNVNIAAATRLGFHGVHHRSADDLRGKLGGWGLL